MDLIGLKLTFAQASGLLDRVSAGEVLGVRQDLIEAGGASLAELPAPNEVTVMRKLGRTTLMLPRGVDVPNGTLTVERTPEGLLIRPSEPTSATEAGGA